MGTLYFTIQLIISLHRYSQWKAMLHFASLYFKIYMFLDIYPNNMVQEFHLIYHLMLLLMQYNLIYLI
jgi:hypothetical protein